jgi:N utilization substance protein A
MLKEEEEEGEIEETAAEGEPRSGREEIKETEDKKIRFNPLKHMMVDEAKKIKKSVKSGDELETELKAHTDFGRIAAQTAKQVIIQRLREAEREAVYDEYKDKEGEIIGGVVQRIEGRKHFVDIGKTIGILFPDEQISGENYRIGQRLRVYLLKVERGPRGTSIYLSRVYPKLVSKLFAIEVPEIAAGTVIIKSIAREPGSRTKIAVFSEEEGVDPVGSLVGQKGTRVQAVINEVNGEKIDIIEWDEDVTKFIANALSPAKVLDVELVEKRREAVAIVPEDQLSLAIGQRGQNVRLAAKLTGWKIDVRSEKEVKAKKTVAKKKTVKKTTKKT